VILLEFAAQGIRGVAPAGGRATLRPGYNVVAADGPALRRLLEALFYPDPRDAEALPRPSGTASAGSLRAGLTLVGNDRLTYRLVRDFQAGAQLHRFEAEKRSFTLVASDLKEIAAFLQKTVGVPPAPRLGALLALAAAELPSRQSAGGLGGGAAPLQQPARSGLAPEQAAKRIAQLRAELAKAKVADKLQAQADENQHRAFKVDEVLKGGAQAREGLAKAEAARSELEPLAQVAATLGDVDARLAQYEKASARREEALARVAAERSAMDDAEAAGSPKAFWKDLTFWASAGGALALVVFAMILRSSHTLASFLAILAGLTPAWGAWVAFRWVGSLEDWERRSRRRRIVDDWEKKIEAQYARDATDVQAAMKAAGVQKLAELKEALGRLADGDAVVAEWRRRLQDWEATPEAAGARHEKARLEEERTELDAKMSELMGGFMRDARSIEAEIQRLEVEAAAPTPAARAPARPEPPRAAGEPLRGLLERAASALGSTPSGAGRALATKASQALSGLSFQRLSGLQVDDRGGIHAVIGGRPTPAMTLPPADRDLVFLALKLALIEQALQTTKGVAVVEDAFAGLSDGARRFAARLLKQIARGAQLLHATTDAAFKEAADHSA
jgi:hypothetical protein